MRKETFIGALGIVAVGELAFGAFSGSQRKKIFKRDGGVSAESGEGGRLEAAHYNHNRNLPGYNDISNGRALTPAEHYADHFNRHGSRGLGLSEDQNLMAVNSLWERLTPEERKKLPDPSQIGEAFIPRRRNRG